MGLGRLVYLKILGGIAILLMLSLGVAVLWMRVSPEAMVAESATESTSEDARKPASQEVQKEGSDPLRVDFEQRK